jgi:hypothetical protein
LGEDAGMTVDTVFALFSTTKALTGAATRGPLPRGASAREIPVAAASSSK